MGLDKLRRRVWAKSSFNPPLSDCVFAPLRGGGEASSHLEYFAEMRKYVEHEDELINSRLTLSLTVHGFLFAAYGLILGKAIDFSTEICKSAPATTAKPESLFLLYIVVLVVALTGVAVGLFSRNAIIAGFNAIQHINTIVHVKGPLHVPLPKEREKVLSVWSRGRPGGWLLPTVTSGGAQDQTTEGAYYYYHILPILLIAAWLVLSFVAVYLSYAPNTAVCWETPPKQATQVSKP